MPVPLDVGGAVNLKDITFILGRFKKRVANFKPFFQRLDAEITELLEQQFETEGRALNTPWKPLADSTVKGRTRRVRRRGGVVVVTTKRGRGKAGPTAVLRDTLEMWGSFVKPGGPMSVRVIREREYLRGSRDPKAAIHNSGSKKRPGHPPRRPIIPKRLPAPVVRAWRGQLLAYLTEAGLI